MDFTFLSDCRTKFDSLPNEVRQCEGQAHPPGGGCAPRGETDGQVLNAPENHHPGLNERNSLDLSQVKILSVERSSTGTPPRVCPMGPYAMERMRASAPDGPLCER